MKKKLLLIVSMFLFITNVKALTFNVNLTNIENKGNEGTIGSIEKIDLEKKELDVMFQDIGDKVKFSLTITNSGDRAGTLRDIEFETGNDKIEYTSDLPDGGLSINGNDTNTVTIIGELKEGAENGKSTSQIKITYKYDEGSCPDGEILSSDESRCLCPEGLERNEKGVCIKPEKVITCEEDEIYNETKKICEKKQEEVVVPEKPKVENPKTLDNIVLITLLFIVSGLGIYAVMYKKLKTKKKKIAVGVITGIITLGASFSVLVSVFGLDRLLAAIVNPITKTKEIVIKVNEEIELIETWDGECSLAIEDLADPTKVFDGGTGTEEDPYQVKTAEQLSCFAKSINNGQTYQDKFVKQTKSIKLNDNLLEKEENNELASARVWLSPGDRYTYYPNEYYFAGTYDGDNHVISGLYITDGSSASYKGLFGFVKNATFKNIILSDVYANAGRDTAGLIGYAIENLTIDNVKTYGKMDITNFTGAGVVCDYEAEGVGVISVTNTENNISITTAGKASGIVGYLSVNYSSEEPNVILTNVKNTGKLVMADPGGAGGILGYMSSYSANVYIDHAVNTGSIEFNSAEGYPQHVAGIAGNLESSKLEITNSYNTGNITSTGGSTTFAGNAGVVGYALVDTMIMDNCYNSGNLIVSGTDADGINMLSVNDQNFNDVGGLIGYNGIHFGATAGEYTISNSYNTGEITGPIYYCGGIAGRTDAAIENSYNTGNIICGKYTGGIAATANTVNNSYNTGSVTVTKGPRAAGILGWSGNSVTNSYNTGKITSTFPKGGSNVAHVGGICNDCGIVKNCYNTGDIESKYNGNALGGIVGYGSVTVENTYNTGNIIFHDLGSMGNTDAMAGGIVGNGGATTKHVYNTGNILIEQKGTTHPYPYTVTAAGISATSSNYIQDSVNTGNIEVKLIAKYNSPHNLQLYGITESALTTDNYNYGTIIIDDSALETPLSEDGYDHYINFGEIQSYYDDSSSGNKFSNQDGFALACYQTNPNYPCTLEQSLAVGTPTSENAPSILNTVGEAFEIKAGDTLPTLKVFNN